MHALHARLPKHFVLEERLERYADAIEVCPRALAGRWRDACLPLGNSPASFRELRLDLGCGKGGFAAESARREPDVLFVGIDSEPICIAYAAQKAVEGGLRNLVLVPGQGANVTEFFSDGEVDRIILNFPTPFPKRKEAHQRLTHLDQLLRYRRILAPTGSVVLKTDSQPLFDFSLTQLALAGFDITWQSADARADRPDDPVSWYEERLSSKGATVYGVEATPGELPEHVEQTAELSLAEYLPDDLENLSYVPHGMEGTVINLRNQRAKRG
jgi:tRNA (guanine-N7-)-methyltransferase